MSVVAETPISSSVANGVTTVFPYSFTVLVAADLKVQGELAGVKTVYTLGVDYTLSGVGTGAGSVTFLAAPASGTVITRYRDTEIKRTTDYQDNGDLLAAVVNSDFDRLWLVLQEIYSGGKGAPTSLRVPSGEIVPALASAATRANRVLAFDSSGDPITIPGVDAGSAAALALALANGSDIADGDAMLAVKQPYTGAVERTQHQKNAETVSVTDLGADPLGIASSTAAFQAAIATGRRVIIPNGTYLVGRLYPVSGFEMVGETKAGVIIKPTGSDDIFKWVYADSGVLFQTLIANMTVDLTGFSHYFINFDGMQYGAIKDVSFKLGSTLGIRLKFSYFNLLENLRFSNCGKAILFDGDSYANGPNHNILRNINMENLTGEGIVMKYCRGNIIDGVDAEFGNNNVKPAIVLENSSYCHIFQFWYEAIYATVADYAIKIIGSSTSNNKKNKVEWSPQIIHPSEAIYVENSLDAEIDNIRFVGGTVNIRETSNSNLRIINPQSEGASVGLLPLTGVSNDTKVVGHDSLKVNNSATWTLESTQDSFSSIKIKSGGVEKFRVTVKPATNEVSIVTNAGEVLILTDTGETSVLKSLQLPNERAAAGVPNNNIFVDTADGKLKYKNASGVVNALY